MSSPRKVFRIIAMGASLMALAVLGSASPGDKDTAPEEAASRPCCDAAEGACCSVAGGQPARSTVLLAQNQAGAQPPASRQQPKASEEALAKGVATRKALLDQVTSLMEDGVADCCIGPGCALCVIAADGCPCAGSLAKAGPVCPECWGGWQAGQGMLPNVKPDNVKILPKDQLKKVYDLKAKKLDQAGQD